MDQLVFERYGSFKERIKLLKIVEGAHEKVILAYAKHSKFSHYKNEVAMEKLIDAGKKLGEVLMLIAEAQNDK